MTRFLPSDVDGATIVLLDLQKDARGSFARTFCEEEFRHANIAMRVWQVNISHNARRRTLRGMHYQIEPYGEPKLVHCVRGLVYDVAIDLRPQSPTFRRWAAVELSPDNGRLFYIPAGCAHGFLTLEDCSDIVYLMGAPYVPAAARGVRWDDPAFAVNWPEKPEEISERDLQYSDYCPRAQ
jgi:dTDP-4-dehydrorhamnose 3,5-epimerase